MHPGSHKTGSYLGAISSGSDERCELPNNAWCPGLMVTNDSITFRRPWGQAKRVDGSQLTRAKPP